MVGLRYSIGIAILLGMGCGACRKHADPIPCLAQVEIAPLGDPSDPVAAIDAKEKRAMEELLRGTLGGVVPECKTPARSRLVARFIVARRLDAVDGKNVVRLKGQLLVSLKGEQSGLGYFEENVETLGRVPVEPGKAEKSMTVARQATQALLLDLTKSYRDRLAIWKATDTQLHATLVGGGVDSKLEAIEVVRVRGVKSEIPFLLKLLVDADERLRDAALGALMQLHVREAVPILTKSREMKDGREMQKILDALAAFGGPEAKSYLSFVAETHDSEPIRELAKRALGRLMQLEKASPTQ